MKNRFLTLALAMIMLVVFLFSFAACNPTTQHSHAYAEEKIDATCTEAGKIIYTCECGDTYTGKGADALGHDLKSTAAKAATCTENGYTAYESCTRCSYSTKVEIVASGHYNRIESFELPSYNKAGSKKVVCETCGEATTEEIAAISVSAPELADAITEIIRELSFTLEVNEGSVLTVATEPTDYALAQGDKAFFAVKLGEAKLYEKDGVLQAYLNLDIDCAYVELDGTVPAADAVADEYFDYMNIAIYVDGDIIAVETVTGEETNEQELSIAALVLGKIMGNDTITADDAMAALYFVTEFGKCFPELEILAENLKKLELPKVSEDFNKDVEATLALFGEKFFVKTENPDGTVEYKSDFTAISVLLDAIKDSTVAEAIDSIYGAGSADALKSFVISIPELTVKEIADFAINASETLGIDVDQVFELVDLYVFYYSGESISIKYQIEKEYNTTVADLVGADREDFDKEAYIAEYKANAEEAFAKIYAYDFEELLDKLLKPAPAPDDEQDGADNNENADDGYAEPVNDVEEPSVEEPSIIDTILEMASAINENVTFIFKLDAEGELISVTTELGEGVIEIEISENGDEVTYTVDVVSRDFDVFDLDLVTVNGVLYSVQLAARELLSNFDEETETIIYELGDESLNIAYAREDKGENAYDAALDVKLYGATIIAADVAVDGDNATVNVDLYEGDGVTEVGAIDVVRVAEGENVITTIDLYAKQNGIDAIVANAEFDKDGLVALDCVVNSITRDYEDVYDEETGEFIGQNPISDFYVDSSVGISFEKSEDGFSAALVTDEFEVAVSGDVNEEGFAFAVIAKNAKDEKYFDMTLVGDKEEENYNVAFDFATYGVDKEPQYDEEGNVEYYTATKVTVDFDFVVGK